jgi:Ca2+-binding EF-hand superfamily protein
MSHDQVQELRAEFENFDTNKNGLISMEEMKTGIINMNVKLGKEKPTDKEL